MKGCYYIIICCHKVLFVILFGIKIVTIILDNIDNIDDDHCIIVNLEHQLWITMYSSECEDNLSNCVSVLH